MFEGASAPHATPRTAQGQQEQQQQQPASSELVAPPGACDTWRPGFLPGALHMDGSATAAGPSLTAGAPPGRVEYQEQQEAPPLYRAASSSHYHSGYTSSSEGHEHSALTLSLSPAHASASNAQLGNSSFDSDFHLDEPLALGHGQPMAGSLPRSLRTAFLDMNVMPPLVDANGPGGIMTHGIVAPATASAPEVDGSGGSRHGPQDEEGRAGRKVHRLSRQQSLRLEETWSRLGNRAFVSNAQKSSLAKELGLLPRQVEVWVQNRRARTKLKRMEAECDALRRCCDTLRADNQRLQGHLEAARIQQAQAEESARVAAQLARFCPSCEQLRRVQAAMPVPSRSPAEDTKVFNFI